MKVLPIVKTDKNMMEYANRCKASFDYFHPDTPMHIVKLEDWREFMRGLRLHPENSDKFSMVVGLFYAYMKMMTEGYDTLLHFDADTVITGRLDEMLIDDYDIAVCNSHSNGLYDSGVWASHNVQFIKDFYLTNSAGSANDCHVFRLIVNSYIGGGKNIKLLDDDESGVWYSEKSRRWWNRLEVKDDKLYTIDNTDPRQIKVMHWAGGFNPKSDRFSCSYFSNDAKLWLNKITNGTTFTDNDGKEYGEWLSNVYRWNK